jgi:hypothetical protein
MLDFLLKNQDGSCKTGRHDKNARYKAQEKVNGAEKRFHFRSFVVMQI